MILKRLYELAEREGLLDDPAFEEQPVPFVIKLGPKGEYNGIEDRRGQVVLPSKKKDAPPKTKQDKGKPLSVPKPHGSPANAGFARFFADTLPRVLPVSDEEKSRKSRATFWQQIAQATSATGEPALQAVQSFGQQSNTDAKLAEQIRRDVEELKPGPSDRCTFAWHPHGGKTVIEAEPVRNWYRQFYASVTGDKQQAGPQGICQITGEIGPLATSHATKISGVPGGLAAGVSVVSNDKAAFESYGLEKAVNSSIGYRAAEGYPRALLALIGNKLPGRPRTSLRVGSTLFLFWTRDKTDASVLSLDEPHPEQVAHLIDAARSGKLSHTINDNAFYCLCLSANAARAIVRDYLELPLPDARLNLGRWFSDLQIIDDSYKGQSQINACFPLWMLAGSTVRDGDDLSPDLPAILMGAALKGTAVPNHVLAACLQRIRVESGNQQLRPARMALIKLILNRQTNRGEPCMTQELDPAVAEHSPGYACGRLLALLARCQSWTDFGASAAILERYFGAASTAPRAVFPLLLRLNRHHLKKIRDENAGQAVNLEKELEERLADFPSRPGQDPDFPAILSLPEQGRFALGFYHQRADYRKQSADKKAAREQSAAK